MSSIDVQADLGIPGKITAVIRPVGGSGMPTLSRVFGMDSISGKEWPLLARSGVCFVPEDAPLLSHRSASFNVRYLCLLSGRPTLSDAQVVLALRCSEVPDDKIHTKAARLSRFDRFLVWLAVHRLRQSHTLVVDNPTRGLTHALTNTAIRLLAEAADIPSAVVVITPDAGFAAAVADRVLARDPA